RKLPHESIYLSIPTTEAAWHATWWCGGCRRSRSQQHSVFDSAGAAVKHITERLDHLASSPGGCFYSPSWITQNFEHLRTCSHPPQSHQPTTAWAALTHSAHSPSSSIPHTIQSPHGSEPIRRGREAQEGGGGGSQAKEEPTPEADVLVVMARQRRQHSPAAALHSIGALPASLPPLHAHGAPLPILPCLLNPPPSQARQRKEADSIRLLLPCIASVRSLPAFHHYMHTEHRAYNVQHQEEFGRVKSAEEATFDPIKLCY
ncbi:unnamed protein product, partial [Closterium sp. Naga37s-1]